MSLSNANDRIANAAQLLPDYLAQHVLLCATALALGVILALPIVVLASRYPRLQFQALTAANLVQPIPGLALLALFYPLLLGISAFTTFLFGFGIPALGFLPSVMALTLYSMLPILRNGVAGFNGIDPVVIEGADAVGMTPRQRLLRVEAPLAAPIVMAGLRTAAVWTIGTATLSTAVGQTSLGNYIFSGLLTENWLFVLFGCVAASALAFVTDQLLGLIETGLARRRRNRIYLGFVGMAAGVAISIASLAARPTTTYLIGAKNFSEQFILADLISQQLKRVDAGSKHREGLGSAIVFRALANSEIDVYVDYVGTLWTNVMGRRDVQPRAAMLQELTRWMAADYGVLVLGSLGLENAYGLAMRPDRAAALGVRTIDDLSRHAPELKLGADLEFLSRPEWSLLRDAYGLKFASERSFNPTFMYRAIAEGDVDVISAFTSDGRITAERLVVLDDTRHAIPDYDAVVLIAPKRSSDRLLIGAITPLIGKISIASMREANLMVDRDIDKATPGKAADFLARAIGLPN